MPLQPKQLLSDVVLARPFEKETVGKIIVLDPVYHKGHKAEVVGIGPGYYDKKGRFIKTTLKPGDEFIYENYNYMKIPVNGEELMMIRERDIPARVTAQG